MKQHPENRKRARCAYEALVAFNAKTGSEIPDDALSDLICDLGHYADQQRIDFTAILARAIGYWKIEQTDPLGVSDRPDVDIIIRDT